MTMTPEQIELARQSTGRSDLCELALDGLMFRAWINGARSNPALVANTLAKCVTVQDYRDAITKLIAARKISP